MKQCILNNPRSTLYVSGEDTNIYNVNDAAKMQKEFISKLALIETFPNTLTVDDYTNFRLYVTDEFLSSAGWDSQKNCPTAYGIIVDNLLNKLSHLAAKKNNMTKTCLLIFAFTVMKDNSFIFQKTLNNKNIAHIYPRNTVAFRGFFSTIFTLYTH